MLQIYCEDCLDVDKKIPDQSVDLGIYDPPFGINESEFDRHYKRDGSNIIAGYREAPADYATWTTAWMGEAKRILKDAGSMYVIIGHSTLRHVLNAAAALNLHEINHLIWKFDFGVNTTRKFVTSHYHVLYYCKSENIRTTFNLNCRFGSHERDEENSSALYRDLEDVFMIRKTYAPGERKNQNKLPEELIRKLILYSSNEGDMVCDFFMGNFTTAYVAHGLGRHVCGYEINANSYDYHMARLQNLDFGHALGDLVPVESIVPYNQGKPISEEDKQAICRDFLELKAQKHRNINAALQVKYGRGKFAIKNILDANLKNYEMSSQLTKIFSDAE